MVTPHNTLESLSATDANHINAVAVIKNTTDQHLIPSLQRLGPGGELREFETFTLQRPRRD